MTWGCRWLSRNLHYDS